MNELQKYRMDGEPTVFFYAITRSGKRKYMGKIRIKIENGYFTGFSKNQ